MWRKFLRKNSEVIMDEIFLNILTVSVSMTPVIIIMIGLIPILSKAYKHGWTYWMWLGVSVRLVLPFSFGGKAAVSIMLPGTEKLIPEGAGAVHIPMTDNIANAVKASSLNPDTLKAAALVYLAGIIIFLGFKLISYAIFKKNIRKYCSEVSEETAELASDIGQSYGVNVRKRRVRILSCEKIPGPMVVGIFRPMLLLPGEGYDYIKIKMILSHELVHIKRHDTAYKFLLVTACAVHWFNPFVHMMCRNANSDMEMSCDARVLQRAGVEEKKTYSLMIIDLASQNYRKREPLLFTSFGSGKETLESRIKNIFGPASRKDGHGILILVFMVILLFGTAVQIAYPGSDAHGAVLPKSGASEEPNENLNIDFNTEHNINNSKVPDNMPIQERQNSAGNEESEQDSSAEVVIIDLNQLKNN